MSYDQYESSRHLGSPDTLYKFTFDTNVYAYTDAEYPITFLGVTYEPIPIDRDPVSTSGTLDKASTGIRVPRDSEVAELFRVSPPSEIVGVTIFQGHDGDPDSEFLAVYVGRVLSCGREDSVATLRCEAINTAMRRPGLRQRYQYGCPHALYGTACGVSRASYERTISVAGVATGVVTLADGWEGSVAAEKYSTGLMIWDNDGRTEIRQIRSASAVSNQVFIDGTTAGLSIGSSVTVAPGCNRQLGDCETVFNNAQNYGGCPWIPKKSPIGFVNQYW